MTDTIAIGDVVGRGDNLTLSTRLILSKNLLDEIKKIIHSCQGAFNFFIKDTPPRERFYPCWELSLTGVQVIITLWWRSPWNWDVKFPVKGVKARKIGQIPEELRVALPQELLKGKDKKPAEV